MFWLPTLTLVPERISQTLGRERKEGMMKMVNRSGMVLQASLRAVAYSTDSLIVLCIFQLVPR